LIKALSARSLVSSLYVVTIIKQYNRNRGNWQGDGRNNHRSMKKENRQ
jgi:hypothetical protein